MIRFLHYLFCSHRTIILYFFFFSKFNRFIILLSTNCRFDQCSVSPLSLKAIKAAGYERLTQVQEATLPVILKGFSLY